MRNVQQIAFFALLFFASCSGKPKAEQAPDDLIRHEEMVQLLADVHLLEAGLGIYGTMSAVPEQPQNGALPHPPIGRNPTVIRPQESVVISPDRLKELDAYDIFKKHGVTRGQFVTTMKWYTSHPGDLSALYDEVITELSRRQAAEQAKKQ
jgi:hypothetical protein